MTHRFEQDMRSSVRPVALTALILFAFHIAPLEAADAPDTDSGASLGRMYTERTWVSYVGLGVQFLADYEENGEGAGLKKQMLFADVNVDGRFTDDCAPGLSIAKACALHAGVRLLLLGTPVATEDGTAAGITPTTFDDVTSAVVFASHVYWSIWQGSEGASNMLVHNAGPLLRGGLISRDRLDTNQDSATWFYQAGLQYTYEPYRTETIRNGLPQGFASVSAARFEDYANLGTRTRLMVDTGYQIRSKLFLGFRANLGSGPDDFSVVLAYYFSPGKIFDLFGAPEEIE